MSFIVRIMFCLQRFQHRSDHPSGGQAWVGGVDQHSWQMDCLTDQSTQRWGAGTFLESFSWGVILFLVAWSDIISTWDKNRTTDWWGGLALSRDALWIRWMKWRDRKTVATLSSMLDNVSRLLPGHSDDTRQRLHWTAATPTMREGAIPALLPACDCRLLR